MRVHPKVLETEIRAADQGMVWYNNIVDHHLFLMLKIELDPNLGTIKKSQRRNANKIARRDHKNDPFRPRIGLFKNKTQ